MYLIYMMNKCIHTRVVKQQIAITSILPAIIAHTLQFHHSKSIMLHRKRKDIGIIPIRPGQGIKRQVVHAISAAHNMIKPRSRTAHGVA
jgi:hypothetical protein